MSRSSKKPHTKTVNPLTIRRNQVYLGLSLVALLAIVARCNSDENPDEAIEAVFYQTAAQCAADINAQQVQYAALQQQYQAGQLEEQPTPPPIQAKDCNPQMLAAQQEYERTAPVYTSLADCQAEGVTCEATTGSSQTGYRPVFGGTYLDTDDSSYVYVNYSGSQYRVLAPRPVYRSIHTGVIVTPYGREIAQSTTGRVTVPRHTTFSAPARPTGTSAKGTIRGRSSQGFGSSFKSSGRGGK